jgi:hypothetical protein
MTPNTLRTLQHASQPKTRSGKRRRRPPQGTSAAGVVRSLDSSTAKGTQAATPQAQSRVRQLNRIRVTLWLPDDCNDVDWDTLEVDE